MADIEPGSTSDGSQTQHADLQAQLDRLKAEKEAEVRTLRDEAERERHAHEAALRKMHEATTARAELERELKARTDLSDEKIEKIADNPIEFFKAIASRNDQRLDEKLSALEKGLEERDQALAKYLAQQEQRVTSTFGELDPRTKDPEFKRIKEILPHVTNDEIFKLMNSQRPPGAPGGSGPVPKKTEPDAMDKAVADVFGGVLSKFKEAK